MRVRKRQEKKLNNGKKCFTLCAMKSNRLFVRVSNAERAMVEKAGMEHKSISAFLLWSVRMVWKYRRLIEQAQRLERRGMKISSMEVRA